MPVGNRNKARFLMFGAWTGLVFLLLSGCNACACPLRRNAGAIESACLGMSCRGTSVGWEICGNPSVLAVPENCESNALEFIDDWRKVQIRLTLTLNLTTSDLASTIDVLLCSLAASRCTDYDQLQDTGGAEHWDRTEWFDREGRHFESNKDTVMQVVGSTSSR